MGKNARLSLLYHGHSNVEILCDDWRIQLDPYYTSNPLADVNAQAAQPNHIFLSHAHFDHVEDAESIARRTGATLVCNYEMSTYYQKKQLKNVVGMNHGGGHDFDFGRATMTLAFHTSSFPDGTYGGEAGGWLLELGGKTIYFAGDTALFADMALIGKLWHIDVALLPIGDNFTMGPDHATRAAKMLNAKLVVPIHYNTFAGIEQDADAFVRRLKKKTGIKGVALMPGDRLGV